MVLPKFMHWITKNYREAYKIFACNGILFNHESPRRGETFVTKKIILGLCNIKAGKQKNYFLEIFMQNVIGDMQKIIAMQCGKFYNKKKLTIFVVATGKQHSVKEFANATMKELGIKYKWKGKGVNEKCLDQSGRIIIECDPSYYRPLEVDTLLGDATKARKLLNGSLSIT